MSPENDTNEAPDNRDDSIDLDAVELDLADVDRALERLEDGTYWTDEVTGRAIDPGHLEQHPTARRNPA